MHTIEVHSIYCYTSLELAAQRKTIPSSALAPSHATRTCIHSRTGLRQTGHSRTRAEQSPQAHLWPHGTAACDLGLTKQTMHVVWPPMVDSGTARRPVSNCAAASDITGSDGNLSSVSAALQQPSPPPQPQQPSPLPQQHPAPPSPQRPSPRPSLWPFLQQQPSQPCLLPQQREPLPPHWHSQQRPGQRPQPLQPCSWLLPRQPSLRSCPPALRPAWEASAAAPACLLLRLSAASFSGRRTCLALGRAGAVLRE
jgi:hypothetical protein